MYYTQGWLESYSLYYIKCRATWRGDAELPKAKDDPGRFAEAEHNGAVSAESRKWFAADIRNRQQYTNTVIATSQCAVATLNPTDWGLHILIQSCSLPCCKVPLRSASRALISKPLIGKEAIHPCPCRRANTYSITGAGWPPRAT